MLITIKDTRVNLDTIRVLERLGYVVTVVIK